MTSCESCRSLFNDVAVRNLAAVTEQRFPDCHCEQFSVGEGSPSRIDDGEILYRMLTDPIDLDQATGQIAREAFEQAYKDGLSIIREQATDAEMESVLKDILSVKPNKERRTIRAVFEFRCLNIRNERCIFQGGQHKAFCVYDQTTPRILEPNDPPV